MLSIEVFLCCCQIATFRSLLTFKICKKMKNVIALVIATLCFWAFVPNKPHQNENQLFGTLASPIDGAWELYSTESGGTTTIHKKPKQIKVYSDGHFCMMAYNEEGKFDFAGAGTYELDGNHYKETFSYSSWPEGVGASLWFDWSKSANGDTLYFSGFKKVIMSDGKDVTKDWGGDSFTEKKVRAKK